MGTNNNFYYVHHSKNFSSGLAKYAGRHNLKAGFDYRRIHDDGNDFANSAGAFTFNGVFTRSTPLTAVSGTGADLADMLLGAPSAGTGYIPTKLYEYADYYGAYFQDDIRVTKSLTINVGLRWELDTPLTERYNRMTYGFDANITPSVQVPGLKTTGGLTFAGVGGTKLPKRSSGNELELILGALADLVARKLRRDVLKQIESQAPFSTGALD